MKQILFSILTVTLFLTSCDKEAEDLFDKPVDERISEALATYQAALVAAPGWKLFVYPQGLAGQGIEVGGLSYYVKFADANRVTMVSDFNVGMAAVPKESGYRLKATQRPSLVFDTYSYIHIAADPDENVSFSPAQAGGYGWGTDFDFSFTEAAPKDTIKLKGNFNNSDAFLVKATQAEMDAAFNAGRLAEIVDATADFAGTSFLSFPASDNSKIGVSFNLFLYLINFTTLTSGGDLVTISAPFSHTTYGIHFKEPISVGGYTFQDLFWDDAQEVYYIQNGGTRVTIAGSSVPTFPFNKVLGKAITTISVPTTALPGQSTLFTTRYTTVKTNLKNGGFNLDLEDIDFIFDDASKTMAVNMYVRQVSTLFLVQYTYSYTINASNIAKFTRTGANGNGILVENSVQPLLAFIDNDRFRLDYYTATTPVLGQFTSQENPTFFFTGTLQ